MLPDHEAHRPPHVLRTLVPRSCGLPKTVYKYADASDNGILVNGTVMFSHYNNALYPSPVAGELSDYDYHVGQRDGGPHCHSDAYQSGQDLGIYNEADYSGKTHPRLISSLLVAPNSFSTNIWVEKWHPQLV